MSERRVTIGWAEGLHARPASVLVKAVTSTGIPITISEEGGTGERQRPARSALPRCGGW